MPTYCFTCKECNEYFEEKVSFSELKEKYNDSVDEFADSIKCAKGHSLTRDLLAETEGMYVISKVKKLEPIYTGRHTEDWQKSRAAKVDAAILEEGISSKQEMQDIEGVCAEEEVNRGLNPGSLTGGVKANPNDKVLKEAVRKRDAKKKNEAQRKRAKLGLRK
jgi:predicted amidohydrolase YtcJ